MMIAYRLPMSFIAFLIGVLVLLGLILEIGMPTSLSAQTPPTAPVLQDWQAVGGGIRLSWSVPQNELATNDNYTVRWKLSGPNNQYHSRPWPTTTNTTYTIIGLTNGQEYDFQVRANDGPLFRLVQYSYHHSR